MTQFGILKSDLAYIISSIKQFKEVEGASIFGSRAMGNFKKGSDIDIALFGKNISLDTLSGIKYLLEDQGPLPYKCDVVDYSKIENPNFVQHIDTYGKSIF